ncbi:MAG: ATP-binding protein [Rhizonema sp. PD37]|nr:ATP-binding protein [Rhizonema sp. PD37]
MLKYPLYNFIATVPSSVETTTLAVVLEIFEEQCDRLVVLDKLQRPIGLLYSAHLIPQLLSAQGDQSPRFLDLQQQLSTLGQTLIQPVRTLPASFSLEQFGSLLRSQLSHTNTNLDWALVDSDGQFLGLVDNSRLIQFLAGQRLSMNSYKSGDDPTPKKAVQKTSSASKKYAHAFGTQDAKAKNQKRGQKQQCQTQVDKPLVQLLEQLPWPIILQTGTGEVVTQNSAWLQQLGVLKDLEGVRQQVEAILATTITTKSQLTRQKAARSKTRKEQHTPIQLLCEEKTLPILNEATTKSAEPQNHDRLTQPPSVSASSQCFLDREIGCCTCIVQVQNGNERVWQFVKIPLDSAESLAPELVINLGEELPSNDLWLLLATDITEQQQLYKELAAKNADLIQLNRLKDEFLACISHELKTPLTAVLGLSRLLVDRQLGELNERQARYAGLIHQSGRHLMSVVNDILDLTRMETGQMDLTLSNVNIGSVCTRALSEAKAIQNQSNRVANIQPQALSTEEHQFTLSVESGLDLIVADELRLRQMLVHLLSNAFKFTETGGNIGLRISRWEGWIAFTVWDTGIGIPEHQQHLIFQKFQQLENPLTRQYEGTGLGLVLTRALARLHGGDVSFLSREGKGTQFTLLLPPSPPQKRAGEQETKEVKEIIKSNPPLPVHSSMQIFTPETQYNSLVLVVEAVARYIEDLTEQLTGLGYRVVIARSGCEAVEKARRLQPKAIFLNPLLPLLSGWDVLTLLKSDAATRHIPVMVTATGAEKEQASTNRADGFLSLPVQHHVLTKLLENLCTTPEGKQQKLDNSEVISNTPLSILRLIGPECESLNSHLSLQKHRVIEVDDLEQAELMARVWQFDVVLLDAEMPLAAVYLQQISQYPRLVALPLVTCNVATTQAASLVPKLSVFPCLTQLNTDKSNGEKTNALLSVLQIAAGASCPPNILVADFSMLPDLPEASRKQIKDYKSEKKSNNVDVEENSYSYQGLKPLTISRGCEWFQALIQYLQTAGFKAAMARSWAELLQQIRHQSIDLLLICLSDSTIQKEVYSALKAMRQLPFNLPPILVLDQRLNANEVELTPQNSTQHKLENVVGAIATQILPRSASMEDLLNQINQVLVLKSQQGMRN